MKHCILFLTLLLRFSLTAQQGDTIYSEPVQQAEFPGGLEALGEYVSSNVLCPDEALKNGIGGKVFVKFVITETGQTTNIEVLKGLVNCANCDAEAKRLVNSMPNWTPAKVKGANVKCYFNMPISFRCAQPNQIDASLVYYNHGIKAFERKNYTLADSLFSLSLQKLGHPDTYFSRAAVRQKIGNTQGYCEDLCAAAVLGDKEARLLFIKNCGGIDTAYINSNNKRVRKTDHAYKLIFYRSIYPNANIVIKYNSEGRFLETFRLTQKTEDSLYFAEVEELAKFPGGISEMIKFIQTHIHYPKDAMSNAVSGKVFLRFIVNETGIISNVEVTQGVPGYPSCDKEAMRIVSIMPKWEPAKMKGMAVKSYFNLPIGFAVSGR